jgi:hypothetical protein
MDDPPADLAGRLRVICLAFPEVTERPSHGAPTWFVRDKSSFVTLWADGHHANQFPHLWCAAPPGLQQELTASEPARFFRPPYVGGRGWVGVRLDGDVDWAEIAELCQDAYRVVSAGSSARLAQTRKAQPRTGGSRGLYGFAPLG